MAAPRATTSATSPDPKHVDLLSKALVAGALPGETAGFSKADRRAAATLALAALDARHSDAPEIGIESGSGSDGRRLLRIAVANDDMPFLVDSIANAITAQGLAIGPFYLNTKHHCVAFKGVFYRNQRGRFGF